MLHSILLILFSTSVFALPAITSTSSNPDQVVLSGTGFKLKRAELTKFLENAYYYPVQKLEVRRMWRNLNFSEPAYIYQRSVSFSVMARSEHHVTCELFIALSPTDDILSIHNCFSGNVEVRSHVKQLSDYTQVTK